MNKALIRLTELHSGRAGFCYAKDGAPASEPTALAALALLAQNDNRSLSLNAGKYLASLQQSDGSVGLFEKVLEPKWPTSLALLLWSSLPEIEMDVKKKAIGWLLSNEGVTFADAKGRDHDNSIPGWPWFEKNYSWVEPTCFALLALNKVGVASHQRCLDGFRLLIDRSLPDGGWNYGSVSLYGRPLRPQMATSGIALLSLACSPQSPPPQVIDKACHYLQEALVKRQTPKSLAWSILGLKAWDRLPKAHEELISTCWGKYASTTENALELALFCLAAWPESLRYIGIRESG